MVFDLLKVVARKLIMTANLFPGQGICAKAAMGVMAIQNPREWRPPKTRLKWCMQEIAWNFFENLKRWRPLFHT
ncbi:MAG: hypothetical protein BGO99_14375 [Nitrosospira sp. 56-18]|nr:MAG: hypothetical protein BGO99_14375 [Nitrosospira sp. 56-18]